MIIPCFLSQGPFFSLVLLIGNPQQELKSVAKNKICVALAALVLLVLVTGCTTPITLTDMPTTAPTIVIGTPAETVTTASVSVPMLPSRTAGASAPGIAHPTYTETTGTSRSPTGIETLYIEQDSAPLEESSLSPVPIGVTDSPISVPSGGATPEPAGTVTIVGSQTTTLPTSSPTSITTTPTSIRTTLTTAVTTAQPTTDRSAVSTTTTITPLTTKKTVTPTSTDTPTRSVPVRSDPSVWFTSIPSRSSSEVFVGGGAAGVPFSQYRVTLYIKVRSVWWGPKPYWGSPYTTIAEDGSWRIRFVTGGVDSEATEFSAYLIPTSYDPPDLHGTSTLPEALERFPRARESR